MNNEQLAMPARNHPYRPTAVRSLFTAHSTLAEIYSFSAKERDVETGLRVTSLRSVSSSSLNQTRTSSVWYSLVRRFGARYYSSNLSIWLSVDPMSDKYPSMSPYVYCADNPVKLVDPDGEEWESLSDAIAVFSMKIRARKEIKHCNKTISDYQNKLKKATEEADKSNYQKIIEDRQARISLLQEGIEGLNSMGESTDYVFHFKYTDNGDFYSKISPYYSGKPKQSLITIYVDDFLDTYWHECIHVSDWLNEVFPRDQHNFSDGVLGHKDDGGKVETHAYRAEFAFSSRRFGADLKSAEYVDDIYGDWRDPNKK